MPQARRLLPENTNGAKRTRFNPYKDTIEEAMRSLGAIEAKIDQALTIGLQQKAREINRRRKVVRIGYVANADSTGWHWAVPQGENYNLRRLTLVGDATGLYGVFIGKVNAMGLRELVNAANNVTFSDGSTGFAYSDAFSNDIYVRAGEDVYIQFLGAATANGHTIVATLEVEEFMPVKRNITEAENLSIDVAAQLDEADAVNSLPPSLIGDMGVPGEHFESPEEAEELQDDTLDVHASQSVTPLIPDVSKHLPAHLRGA